MFASIPFKYMYDIRNKMIFKYEMQRPSEITLQTLFSHLYLSTLRFLITNPANIDIRDGKNNKTAKSLTK